MFLCHILKGIKQHQRPHNGNHYGKQLSGSVKTERHFKSIGKAVDPRCFRPYRKDTDKNTQGCQYRDRFGKYHTVFIILKFQQQDQQPSTKREQNRHCEKQRIQVNTLQIRTSAVT